VFIFNIQKDKTVTPKSPTIYVL